MNQSYWIVSTASIAVGGTVDLAKNLESMENLGINLAAQGSVLYTQQKLLGQNIVIGDSEVKSHQFDFSISATKTLETKNGSRFSPYFLVGLHGENVTGISVKGMNYESGFKFNMSTGLSLASSGYLLQDQNNQIHRWHLNSSFNFDSNFDQQGIMIHVSPTIGSGKISQPDWISTQTTSFGNGDISESNSNQVASELGYGFDLFDGQVSLNPYSRFELIQSGLERFSVGGRASLGSNFNVEILGTRDISKENSSQQLSLKGGLSW